MSELQNSISNFSDEYLLDQYHHKREEYTGRALALMKEEILRRNLKNPEKETPLENDGNNNNDENALSYPIKEFVQLIYPFPKKDVLLARDILTEENIPGFIKPSNSSVNDEIELYSIFVPGDLVQKAQEYIQKYFIESDGLYQVKFHNTIDRLKAFNFHELQFSGTELDEELDVEFSEKESKEILFLIKRLISDADRIELTGKILFYYDNLEACESHFSNVNSENITRADLITVLEVLQVYCEDINFSEELLKTVKALLDFFGI